MTCLLPIKRSDGFLDFAGTDAAGANLNGFDRTVLDGADLLQIRIPDSTSFVVCVTDVISSNGFFPADFTLLRHLFIPPESFERALLTRFQ